MIAHMHSNLILEQGGMLFKWPKYKTRLLYESPEEDFDNVLAPKARGKKSRATKARGSADPPGWTGKRPPASSSSDEESSAQPKTDWDQAGQISIDIEKDLDDILAEDAKRELEGRQFRCGIHRFDTFYRSLPTSSFSVGGPLICSDSTSQTEYACICADEPLYWENRPHLIWSMSAKGRGEKFPESQRLNENVWFGDEIVGQFDPSRIPPRIAFRLEKARAAIIKEIDDLLTPNGHEPPAMVEASLTDPKYRGIALSLYSSSETEKRWRL